MGFSCRYLDSVLPGDGGLAVLPGSHKSAYDRPEHLFGPHGGARGADVYSDPARHELSQQLIEDGMRLLRPQAGDAVLMSEATVHTALPWRPTDRRRRTLVLRYQPQHTGALSDSPGAWPSAWPDEIAEVLAPETRELIAPAHVTHLKNVAARAEVTLSEPQQGARQQRARL